MHERVVKNLHDPLAKGEKSSVLVIQADHGLSLALLLQWMGYLAGILQFS